MSSIVILPTYSEANNLEPLIGAIRDVEAVDAVVVVDDNSPDGTGEIADRLALVDDFVHVIHRSGKLGLGTAYQAGFSYALAQGADRVLTMDADFSHAPEHLSALVSATQGDQGADLAIGSRYVPGGATVNWSLLRKLISGSANRAAIGLLGLPAKDCTSGFRCYRASILEAIDYGGIRSDGYSYLVEALYRVGRASGKVVEIPITFRDRQHDQSKISRVEIVKGVATLLRLRLGR